MCERRTHHDERAEQHGLDPLGALMPARANTHQIICQRPQEAGRHFLTARLTVTVATVAGKPSLFRTGFERVVVVWFFNLLVGSSLLNSSPFILSLCDLTNSAIL